MDLQQRFMYLLYEHLQAERSAKLSFDDDAEKLLTGMLPIELFLKERYLAGDRRSFDEYQNPQKETSVTSYGLEHNISTYRHFRYDCVRSYSMDCFEMDYVYSGGASIEIDGEAVPIIAGDMVILAPYVLHRLQVFCDDCVVLKIFVPRVMFENTFYNWLVESNPLTSFFRRVLQEDQRREDGAYVIFRTGNDPFVRSLVLHLMIEKLQKPEYSQIVCSSILTELFCRLVRSHLGDARIPDDRAKNGDLAIGRILQTIREDYRTLTLEDISRRAGYSKNYFCRLISEMTGHTFTQLLNDARINAAAQLLAKTDWSVDIISKKCGYQTPEHFYRTFKKLKGIPPKQYRRQMQQNDLSGLL